MMTCKKIVALFFYLLAVPAIAVSDSRLANFSPLGIGVPYPLARLNLLDSSEPFNSMVLANTAYGLMRSDKDGGVTLQLAAGFNSSDDNRIFVFTLKQNLFFPNATALNERAVKSSFEYFLARKNQKQVGAELLRALNNIKAIELIQSRTATNNTNQLQGIRFLLENGDENFLSQVATLPIIDAKHANLIGSEFGTGTLTTATGPYLIRENRPDKGVVLEANPEFHRAGYPRSRLLSFESFDDSQKALSALRVGSIDIIAFTTPELIAAIKDDPTLALIDSPLANHSSPSVSNWKSDKSKSEADSQLIVSKAIVRKSLELDSRFFENFDVSGVFLP